MQELYYRLVVLSKWDSWSIIYLVQGFDYKELLVRYRLPILFLLIGLTVVAVGIFLFKSEFMSSSTKVEVLGDKVEVDAEKQLTVEISGEVIKPGVYTLVSGSRINDLIMAAGDFSTIADKDWINKYLNRAAKLTDGQKVFIPSVVSQSGNVSAKSEVGYQTISSSTLSDSSRLVNINTGSLSELDTLPGIGQVYGQKIVEHRPYSNVEELVSKGVIKQSLFNKIKDLITIY